MKNVEIPKWLERLPLAPEFHPTDTEFADPIAYISKIEKEASAFGICKVIPPLPKPSRKYVLHNLNKSLLKCPELGSDASLVTSSGENCDRNVKGGNSRAFFTTRHQELGCEKGKKVKGMVGDQIIGVQKQVWQSGEVYTLEQFEAKAKIFAKSQLGVSKEVDPLVVEAMFWKAASEKPIYVEYANDVPGSGFGEPEGLFRYFDRRRRRRRKRNSFDMNTVVDSHSSNDQVDPLNSIRDSKDSDSQSDPNFCEETVSDSLPLGQAHHGASFSERKDSQGSDKMEGTAGWKLSNSPWNLQVVARSPGSLTRFMPDDIPGVTSPMVYIGMLFSWFAWHVEDHELHSLNFLHMGSSKTWYAVPGDYAFNFEETICVQGYGANADRLVALSRLGEKTTVCSPEIIVASGIPCCRLVQNPGEFVVTFPRAYHIGFSHGFNCGEAANFGTPRWLTIAKEAAVRRAVMNYLPMLSHQQLLYLLTMSFISRIPRSLLPGVRSSRLRDRQKEEREVLVKRAFIEDILHANRLSTILLQRNSSYYAVLWDVESIPSSSKESESCKDTDAPLLPSMGRDSPKNDENIQHDIGQLNNYISEVGFDLTDDDLAYDFQIESGTLPCVACGILGFPFMVVVQPSNLNFVAEWSTTDDAIKAKSNSDLCHVSEASSGAKMSQLTHSPTEQSPVSDQPSSLKHQAASSEVENIKGWNLSNVLLKPRIFCLEHAIEIEDLLSSKGGANILVICHSDFQKIKTHAAVIAEEIAIPFCYAEIPLNKASPEDLNLIDISIDREQVDCVEEWTSCLSINLQHCVKMKKSSPSKNVGHLFSLDGLFRHATPVSNTSSIKWISRKLRSNRHLKNLFQSKPKIMEDVENRAEQQMCKKDLKVIQYSRKKYKAHPSTDVHLNSREDPDKEDKNTGGNILKNVEEEMEISPANVLVVKDIVGGNSCHELQVEVADECTQKSETYCSETVDLTSVADSAAEKGNLRDEETMNETCIQIAEKNLEMPSTVLFDSTKEASKQGADDDDPPSGHDEQMESNLDRLVMDSEASLSSTSQGQQDIQNKGDNDEGSSVTSPQKKVANMPDSTAQSRSTVKAINKRKREVDLLQIDEQLHIGDFIRSPCEGLRPRRTRYDRMTEDKKPVEEKLTVKKSRQTTNHSAPHKNKKERGRYECDLDGCTMTFGTKAELVLHKGNRCPVDGCRKKFNSHKYAVQHQRVHDDDRPLKCPWNGCTMSFKWAWARTEHLRVHTGERPYICKVEGCGLSFRFVSDFSRHRRKTGHYVSPSA